MVDPNTMNTDKFLVVVDGVDLSDYVTKFEYSESDISTSDSGRSDTGRMNLDIVDPDEIKLSIEWTDCPSSYKRKIKNAINKKIFNIQFVDGDDDDHIDCETYRGDRQYTMTYSPVSKKRLWKVTLSFIDMGGH